MATNPKLQALKRELFSLEKKLTKKQKARLKRTKLTLAQKAEDDSAEVYNSLKKHLAGGNPWAFQIYYKDILSKRSKEDKIKIPPLPQSPFKICEYLESLTQALLQFEDFTREEIIDTIKVLSTIKSMNNFEQQEQIYKQREDLFQQLIAIREAKEAHKQSIKDET